MHYFINVTSVTCLEIYAKITRISTRDNRQQKEEINEDRGAKSSRTKASMIVCRKRNEFNCHSLTVL